MRMIHATCVAIAGNGILLRGPSGHGKSDLALRLLDDGACLVADDQVVVEAEAGGVVARAPAPIAGKLEVRGLGPVSVDSVASAPIRLVVDLTPGEVIERLPERQVASILGVRLPVITLDPFHASAPAKVRVALTSLTDASAALAIDG